MSLLSEQPSRAMPVGRPFPKGVSGNPGGKPHAIRQVEALARSYAPELVVKLYTLATTSRSEKIQLAAADALLSRGLGRPKETVAIEESSPLIATLDRLAPGEVQAVGAAFGLIGSMGPNASLELLRIAQSLGIDRSIAALRAESARTIIPSASRTEPGSSQVIDIAKDNPEA